MFDYWQVHQQLTENELTNAEIISREHNKTVFSIEEGNAGICFLANLFKQEIAPNGVSLPL